MSNYLKLENLEVYLISRELSDMVWDLYIKMNIDTRIIIGQQFVRCIDSIGANIAEGYGRFHFLEKVKFYYIARASLFEAKHFCDLLLVRSLINDEKFSEFKERFDLLHKKLNAYIKLNKDKSRKS